MPQLKTPSSTFTNETGIARSALEALKETYNVRLDAMDKAISVAHEDLVRFPTEIDKSVGALEKVISEKFATVAEKFISVEKQFNERDTRATEKAELTQKALDAALLTAEKAVGKQSEAFAASTAKSEASATKQIDAIGVQLATAERNANEKNATLTAQVARLDNLYTSLLTARNTVKEGADQIWGRIAVGAAVGGGLVALIQFLATK